MIPDAENPLSEPLAGNYFVAAYPPFSAWSPAQAGPIAASLATLPAASDLPWGAYIHLPFCEKRCDYCYYLSFGGTPRRVIRDYLEKLVHEARLYARLARFAGRGPRFIYFGGGTPSLLAADMLQSLLAELDGCLEFNSAEEITFECSPKSITAEKLAILYAAGVNRISLGVQQLDDNVLRLSGRIHLEEDVRRAAAGIAAYEFAEFNVDLIAGLRGQSDASFLDGVKRVIDLAPDCVTIYQLEVPQNTPLFKALDDARVSGELADWENKRRRVVSALDLLERHGYTVRNAYSAAKGKRRRRFAYTEEQYRGADLVGLGLSSFSYVAGRHFQNTTRPQEYGDAIARGELPISRGYTLGREEQMVREFILQLKLGSVSREYFREKFGADPVEQFAQSLGDLAGNGYVTWDEQRIAMTRTGLVRVDRLLPAFYLSEHQDRSYW